MVGGGGFQLAVNEPHALKAVGGRARLRGPLHGQLAPLGVAGRRQLAQPQRRYLSVGSLEPAFYRNFVEGLGLGDDPLFDEQFDPSRWPAQKARFAEVLATRPRDEWCAHFESIDACVAPVLDLDEATQHAHNVARGTFTEVAGVRQPAPAPKFSETPPEIRRPPPKTGANSDELLAEAGFSEAEIGKLREAGAV